MTFRPPMYVRKGKRKIKPKQGLTPDQMRKIARQGYAPPPAEPRQAFSPPGYTAGRKPPEPKLPDE